MYDSRVGRFLSQDPLGLEAGDGNFYRYVANSPVNRIDPAGLIGQPQLDQALAFVQQQFAQGNSVTMNIDGTDRTFGPQVPLSLLRTILQNANLVVVHGLTAPPIPPPFRPIAGPPFPPAPPQPENYVTSLRDCTDERLQAMSVDEKFVLAIAIAYEKGMLPEAIATEIGELLKRENLAMLLAFVAAISAIVALASAAGSVGAASGPPGWVADALLAVGCLAIGADVAAAFLDLYWSLDSTDRCNEMVDAARVAASSLATLGIDAFLLILAGLGWTSAKAKAKAAKAAGTKSCPPTATEPCTVKPSTVKPTKPQPPVCRIAPDIDSVGVGTHAIMPPGFGMGAGGVAGPHPALYINGRVYVHHHHLAAQELAGQAAQPCDLYGIAVLDALGNVLSVHWVPLEPR